MLQPTKDQILEKVRLALAGKITREEVGEWALTYIVNDNFIEVNDIEAWHFLVAVSMIDEMTAPGIYLYNSDDIKDIIEVYK